MRLALVALVACSFSWACPSAPIAPTPSPAPLPSPPVPTGACGMSPSDWCPSRPEDPCGAHRNEASCRADPNCEGMPYRGESAVPCMLEDRCFASNCPAVGCVSRCETLAAACTVLGAGRCQLDARAQCVRMHPCAR